MQEFSDKGYDAVILLHDLDRWKELGVHKDRESLYQKLANIPVPSNIKQFICIPIEELEAWFWCDQNIIDKLARGKSKEKPHSSPHKIVKPKEKLIELSGKYGRPFYDTNMNKELAAILDLELCSQTCPAFQGLKDFILSLCI